MTLPSAKSHASLVILIPLFSTVSLSRAQTPTAPPVATPIFPEVTDVDHAAVIRAWGDAAFARGKQIYETVCFACHGIDGKKVSVQGARAFAVDPLANPPDPYGLFKTITFGFNTMPQQQWMTPAQRYDVVHFIREAFLRTSNPDFYAAVDEAYLKTLPKPDPAKTAPPPERRPADFGPVLCSNLGREYPLVLTHRLPGDVSVSYDLLRMRLAGVWTGGFLNLSDTRFTLQRGESPARPDGEPAAGLETWKWAWAGSFDSSPLHPRSPAPEEYVKFLGHFVHGDRAVMSYRVAGTPVLEMPEAERIGDSLVLKHILRIDPSQKKLELCVAELDEPGPMAGVMAAAKEGGNADRTVALVTALGKPVPAFSPPLRFVADPARTRDQLAMAEKPFAVAVRFRTTERGTLVCNAMPEGKWIPNGKTLFVDKGGKLTYDIGWVGAMKAKEKVNDGDWHTALVTTSEGGTRLFLDGALAGGRLGFARSHVDGSVFKIGTTASDFGGDFIGDIEWVRFFDRALDDAMCKSLSKGTTEGSPKPDFQWKPEDPEKPPFAENGSFGFHVAAAVAGDAQGLAWRIDEGRRLVLEIPPAGQARKLAILCHAGAGPDSLESFRGHAALRQQADDVPDLSALIEGGPNRFPQPITVTGKLGNEINGYALDTIPLPDDNPYGAWMRTSCLGFFDDGRCAVGTYTGDIWIVSGIDAGLEHVTWQRFAAGLYEPFGILVIDGLVHVTCRDGIKRLHDFNGDGYADFYETFFPDPDVSSFFHGFCFDLHRDSKGRLYYAKSGQYTSFKKPGAVLQVAPDGKSFEYFATGFRTPNGMGMMPSDLPLCSDNEGNWMPASKISLCREGGFYGYVQTHAVPGQWAPDGGLIDHTKVARPASYDPPILWLPVSEDNSSGSQLWVADRRFGPLSGSGGRLLHSSFGKGWVYYLMLQEIDGQTQAACVTLPHQWDAGVQRLRLNPADGQLYGAGLSGWQGPPGGKDGCLQRLRYTGGECRMIDNIQVTPAGIEVTFNFPLNRALASDPRNFRLEMWNYDWHPEYGSKFFSVRDPGKTGVDSLTVNEARVSKDNRQIELVIEDFVRCDQLKAELRLEGADGRAFDQKFYQTIHRIPAKHENECGETPD